MSAFEADRFNRSRTSPEHQLSVASCQWPARAVDNGSSRTTNDQRLTNQRLTTLSKKFLYHVVGLLRRGNRPHSRRRFDRLETPVVQVEVGSGRWRLGIVPLPGLCAGGEQFFYVGRDRTPLFLHARDGRFHARRVP